MAISNNGCRADTAFKSINVSPIPVISFITTSGGWKKTFDLTGGSKRLDTLILADNNHINNNAAYKYSISGIGITTDSTGVYVFNPEVAGISTDFITINVGYSSGLGCTSTYIDTFQVGSGVFANLTRNSYCTNLTDSIIISVNASFESNSKDIWLYSPSVGYFLGVHNECSGFYNDPNPLSVNPIQYIGTDGLGHRQYIFDPRIIPAGSYYVYNAVEYTPGCLTWREYAFIQIYSPDPTVAQLPDNDTWHCSTASIINIQDPSNSGSYYDYYTGSNIFRTDSMSGPGIGYSGGAWKFDPSAVNLGGADADTVAIHYYYTDRGGQGCFATTDINIEVRRTPGLPAVTNDTVNYCAGTPIQDLNATADPGASVTWYKK